MLGMNSGDTHWTIIIVVALLGYTIVHTVRAWRNNDRDKD